MSSALTLAELLDQLESGKLLLLPNSRAARELRSAYDAHQRARGHTAWEPAAALSWQQWAGGLWSELVVVGSESRLLLNSAQEHSLWRDIICDDASHRTLGSPDTLAELAHSAWTLAAAYSATGNLRGAGFQHDSRIFSQWTVEFSKRCAATGCLSSALLEDALRRHVASGALPAPETLTLAGFGNLSPAQESLLSTLQERGTAIERHELAAAPIAERLRGSVIAANPREELQLATHWVRGYLEEHRDAQPRVAILLPNLNEDQAELESVLREILAPELQSVTTDLSCAPWEISATAPLASLHMISIALDLAHWTIGPISIERISGLLLSSCLGRIDERDALARFDAHTLRRQPLLRSEMDIAGLLLLLTSRDPDTPSLAPWLRDVASLARRAAATKTATFADWMEHIRALLAAAIWSGADSTHALTATEFEAARAWDSVLDMVSTLDFSGRRVSFAVALDALDLQARRTLFAPPSTHAPVRVMSITEAEGCLFDSVVFLRATDDNWPTPQHAHPLLPWGLQRSLSMPGTDAAHDTGRSQAFTAGLLERTGSILFTSAAENNDGKLRPSPLLSEFGLQRLSPSDLLPPAPTKPHIETETVLDDMPLPPLTSHVVKGGAAVLQAQAACGFRAFAKFRLHSTGLDLRDLGLDVRDSGNHIHLALETFWKQVKSQKKLRESPPEEIDSFLRNSIDTALQRHFTPSSPWDTAYLDLQRRRLHKLLKDWLRLEMQRGPFEVIDAEHKTTLSVGPLDLDLRLDRMDRVGDGEDVVLVDYKTGSASPKDWEDERPDQPQLPLYALYPSPETVKAVAFATIRPGKQMKWSGYQAEEGILPKARDNHRDLNLLIEEWRITLTQLAQNFADGKAFVDPKNYPATCKYCDQRLLCRLDPTTLREHNDDAATEGYDG
jgi:probable DNA repair protein